jgi:hypothetical protein
VQATLTSGLTHHDGLVCQLEAFGVDNARLVIAFLLGVIVAIVSW